MKLSEGRLSLGGLTRLSEQLLAYPHSGKECLLIDKETMMATFYPIGEARKVAREAEAADKDGWKFVVIGCYNGQAFIVQVRERKEVE